MIHDHHTQPIVDLEKVPSKEILPGFTGRFVHTETMTVAYWSVKKGSVLPKHNHHHEQITQVTEGEFAMTIGNTTSVLTAGKVVLIPSDVPHEGRALSDCKIIDVFSPRREEYS